MQHVKKIALTVLLLLCANFGEASPTLQQGSEGHNVRVLQQKLKEIGYAIPTVDGVYGPATERAVATFQRDNKLPITGIVKNSTWRALQKRTKPTKKAETPAKDKKEKGKKGYRGKITASEVLKFPVRAPRAAETPPFLAQSKVAPIVASAKKYLGVPYKFGGATPKGFDCSGYLQYIFAQNGVKIPRTADEQYKIGKNQNTAKLVPGDLVFFSTYEPGPSHCGLYLGGGKFIHASSSKGVRVDELTNEYWKLRYLGGKKIVK